MTGPDDGSAFSAIGTGSWRVTAARMEACTFWNARTSTWRMRSRLTPNSSLRDASVRGASRSRRSVKIARSRSLSSASARPSRALRCASSSDSASVSSMSASSLSTQSSHSEPSSRSPNRGVQRLVHPRESAIHRDHIALGDIHTLRNFSNLLGRQIAAVNQL